MSSTYTIWLCCGEYEQEDSRQEALGMAAAIMDGDGPHSVLAVEGPDGEDLMADAEVLSQERSKEWLAKSRQMRTELLGYVEIMGPTGQWWGRDPVYSAEQRDTELAEARAAYGEARVRWVEKT